MRRSSSDYNLWERVWRKRLLRLVTAVSDESNWVMKRVMYTLGDRVLLRQCRWSGLTMITNATMSCSGPLILIQWCANQWYSSVNNQGMHAVTIMGSTHLACSHLRLYAHIEASSDFLAALIPYLAAVRSQYSLAASKWLTRVTVCAYTSPSSTNGAKRKFQYLEMTNVVLASLSPAVWSSPCFD